MSAVSDPFPIRFTFMRRDSAEKMYRVRADRYEILKKGSTLLRLKMTKDRII